MSRSNPYKWVLYFWLLFQQWRLVTRPTCNIISNGFLFCIPRKLYFHFWSKSQGKNSNRIGIAFFHSHGNSKGRTLDHFFMLHISIITSPTNWYLYRWVSWNISEVINENSTSAFNYLDDFSCIIDLQSCWLFESSGINVLGLDEHLTCLARVTDETGWVCSFYSFLHRF